MMPAGLLLVAWIGALAEAPAWVDLEICRVDYSASPFEARPDGRMLFLRPEMILGLEPVRASGIVCCRISSGQARVNVVGPCEELKRLLAGSGRKY